MSSRVSLNGWWGEFQQNARSASVRQVRYPQMTPVCCLWLQVIQKLGCAQMFRRASMHMTLGVQRGPCPTALHLAGVQRRKPIGRSRRWR